MSEDIEAKIRRLRELGKASADTEVPRTSAPPVKKPPRKPRRMGSIRDRERRRRILIGSAIILLIVLAVSVGAYAYLQNKEEKELSSLRAKKIAEVNTYFNENVFNNTNCTKEVNQIKAALLNQILSAKSVEELEAINVRASYEAALKKYNECLQRMKELELERQLNATKMEKIKEIELEFQPLLSMPLPDDLKSKAVKYLKELENRVMSARSIEEVKSIKADPYLLELWRDYQFWRIDQLARMGHKDVILEYKGTKKMVSIQEAKAILGGILDYRELMEYKVMKVEWVELSLVLPKRNINGAFISPGDRIKIYIRGNTTSFDGYFELVLLPVQGGSISVSESQSQSSSSSGSSSTTYSESHSTSASPGGASISDSSSASDSYTNSQSASQSSSASYSYSVNLGEILKAIAAGKIQASEQVRNQLNAYGWKVLNLEQETALAALDSNTQLLVIVRVPSIFVPDILQNQNNLYIVRVAT